MSAIKVPSCKICLEHFNATDLMPKLLSSCGHSLCLKCAARMTDASNCISCHKCRQKTRLVGTYGELNTNYDLLAVVEHITSIKLIDKSENTDSCTECRCNFKTEKLRYCNTCAKGEICAECWVEMHNGHEPISLKRMIEMERQNSLAEFKQLKKELEKIVSDYEESSRSVSLMFSFIKQEMYGPAFTTIDAAVAQFESSTITDRQKMSCTKEQVADAKKLADQFSLLFIDVKKQITEALKEFFSKLSNNKGHPMGSKFKDQAVTIGQAVQRQLQLLKIQNQPQSQNSVGDHGYGVPFNGGAGSSAVQRGDHW